MNIKDLADLCLQCPRCGQSYYASEIDCRCVDLNDDEIKEINRLAADRTIEQFLAERDYDEKN